MAGIAPVVAVDCDDAKNKAICSRYGVQGFPTLKAGDFATLGRFKDYCCQDLGCLLFAPRRIYFSRFCSCKLQVFRPQAKPNPYTKKYDKTATDYMGEQATAATPQPELVAAVHSTRSRFIQLLPDDILTCRQAA